MVLIIRGILIIYIVFICVALLAIIAKKSNRTVYVCGIILILSLFVGLRDISIGDDTETYYQMFLYLRYGIFSPNYEYGFSLISYFILKLFNDIHAPFIVFSFITNTLIICRLWEIRNRYSFVSSIVLYMILYYPSCCNIMRQYLAIAIIFWGLRFLEKDKLKIYLLIVLLSISIHTSAAVAIFYIFIYEINTKRENKRKTKMYIVLGLVCVPILAIAAYYVFGHYAYYFLNNNNSVGLFNFIRIMYVLIGMVLSYSVFSQVDTLQIKFRNRIQKNQVSLNKIILISYSVGVLLYFLGYYKTTIMRIGIYFGINEILFIPLIVKNGRGKQVMSLLYWVLIILYFIINVKSGWSELGDYVSFLSSKGL